MKKKTSQMPKRLPKNPFEDSIWNFMLYLFNRPRWDKKVAAQRKKYEDDYDKWRKYGELSN